MIKNLASSLILTGSLLFSGNAKCQNIEDYWNNQIYKYELEGNKTKALATEYKLEKIKEAKKIWEQNGTLYTKNKISNNYSWDKIEIGLAAGYIFSSMLDTYQSMHVPEGFHEGGKSYLFNWNNSSFGAVKGNSTSDQIIAYTIMSNTAWITLCDLIPKHVTNHFIPEKYNNQVRKTMLGFSILSSLTNLYNNEKITGGIIFKKAF